MNGVILWRNCFNGILFYEVSLQNANSNHQEHMRDIIDTYNALKKGGFRDSCGYN